MEKPEYEKAKTAFDNKIQRLYHYQRFNLDDIIKLLKENTIYCSNPKNFNDPWDCKPWFNTSLLDDPLEFNKAKEFLIKNFRDSTSISDHLQEEMIEIVDSVDRAYIEKILTGWFVATSESHSRSFRIYCLTPYCDNSLMWAHYADKHKGICLEFDSSDRVFGGAWQVKYNNTFSGLRFYDKNIDPMFQLLNKSDVWKYEDEYRIVAREPTGNPEYDKSPLGSVEGIFKLPENSLKSIIVGCAGPYQEVVDLVKNIGSEVKVKKVVKAPHRYDLEIE